MTGNAVSHPRKNERLSGPGAVTSLLRPTPAARKRESHAASMVANIASAVAALDGKVLTRVAELINIRFRSGRAVIVLGNGGSCATASHMATDLTLLARAARRRVSVFALYDNSSLLSAMANDYGFDESGASLIDANASRGDLLIVFSCSGRSQNIVTAAQRAASLGVSTVLVGSELAPSGFPADHLLLVPSTDYSVIESAHLAVVHVVVDLLRARLNLASSRHPGAATQVVLLQP